MQFIVVGNGVAGITAASTIRRLDRKAGITMISEEPHPAYSACVLSNYLSGGLEREKVFLKGFFDYLRENIELIAAQKVISLNIGGKEVGLRSRSISYDKLIIATGSKPAIPPIKGTDKEGTFTFKSLEDADKIYQWDGQTAVVVGSGPIGIEVSLALKEKGYQVFLVELLSRILPRVFDEYPASIIRDILEEGGIEVSTQERIVEILGSGRVEGVATDKRKIKCDTVILAAGMRPQVGLAEGALRLGKLGGILVDDEMGTSVQDVYACGDCVETKDLISGRSALNLLWHNARQQGSVAGYNAVGIARNYLGSLNFTGVELFGTHAVSIGSTTGASQDGLEMIEGKRGRHYQRLILSNGVLIGVQSIDWSENMGALLTAILRQEKVTSPRNLFMWRKPLFKSRRCFPFGRRLMSS